MICFIIINSIFFLSLGSWRSLTLHFHFSPLAFWIAHAMSCTVSTPVKHTTAEIDAPNLSQFDSLLPFYFLSVVWLNCCCCFCVLRFRNLYWRDDGLYAGYNQCGSFSFHFSLWCLALIRPRLFVVVKVGEQGTSFVTRSLSSRARDRAFFHIDFEYVV